MASFIEHLVCATDMSFNLCRSEARREGVYFLSHRGIGTQLEFRKKYFKSLAACMGSIIY